MVKRTKNSKTNKTRVWDYLEERYQVDQPASFEDFIEWSDLSEQECAKNSYQTYMAAWKNAIEVLAGGDERESARRQAWYGGNRYDKPISRKNQVWQYLGAHCESDQPANYAEFLAVNHFTVQDFSKGTYDDAVKRWGELVEITGENGDDKNIKRQIWYRGRRRDILDTLKIRVSVYLEERFQADQLASFEDFLGWSGLSKEDCAKNSYQSYLTQWKYAIEGLAGGDEKDAERHGMMENARS